MKMVEGVRSQVPGNDQVIVEEEVINNGEVFAVLPVLLEKVVLRHVDWPALSAVFSTWRRMSSAFRASWISCSLQVVWRAEFQWFVW